MASNRQRLRDLSRSMPATPEIDRMMDELRGGNDMAVALLAGSFLEVELERLLIAKMHDTDTALRAALFLNRGPLADMHSKILVAHAFGVITGPMASELQSLRAIRNSFAHARVPLTFDHSLVAKEVADLKTVVAMNLIKAGGAPVYNLDNKGTYLLITRILLILFDQIAKGPGFADDRLAQALFRDSRWGMGGANDGQVVEK